MDLNQPQPGPSSTGLTKSPRSKPLGSGEKRIVYNVFLNSSHIEVKRDRVAHTANLTGVGASTIWRIIKEMDTNQQLSSPERKRPRKTIVETLGDASKVIIRRTVHDFFIRNELPTIDKIKVALDEIEDLPEIGRTTLWKVLRSLGFSYSKRGRKCLLLERNDLVSWRRNYLLTIRKYRQEGRKIYYLDETWVNAGHTKSKVWQNNTVRTHRDAYREGLSVGLKSPSGKGKRLIIAHIGSETGFVNGALFTFESKKTGDYHEDMSGVIFMEWIRRVLPLLEENSVIVMDNASYHSMKVEQTPSKAWLKSQLLEWLDSKNIETRPEMVKSDLVLLAQEHILRNPIPHVIDSLVEETGRKVLRTPPYHCNLNPIEMVWAQVKGHVASNNKTFKLADVTKLLEEGVYKVTPEKWSNCVRHVMEEEEKLIQLDHIVDNLEDRLIIDTTDDSSDDDNFPFTFSDEDDVDDLLNIRRKSRAP